MHKFINSAALSVCVSGYIFLAAFTMTVYALQFIHKFKFM